MGNQVQVLRSSVPGARPAAKPAGTLYANFADKQLGIVDPAAAAVDVIAIRFFSALANYILGDYVVQAGQLYRANAAVPAGAFNAGQWTAVGGSGGAFLPLAGGTLTGPLVLAGNAVAALNPVTLQQMNTAIAGAGTAYDQSLNKADNVQHASLKIGGITAAFPMLKPNGPELQVRLADDSAFGNLQASNTLFTTIKIGGTGQFFPMLKATGACVFVRTADDSADANLFCQTGSFTALCQPSGAAADLGAINNRWRKLWSVDGEFSGNLGIGMTPVNVLDITYNVPGTAAIQILNNNPGATANAKVVAYNGTSALQMIQFGVNLVLNGMLRPNGSVLYTDASGGLTIETAAPYPIYFGINGLEKARFDNTGAFIINTTASAAKLHVANGNDSTTVNFIGNSPTFNSHMLFISAQPNTSNGQFEAVSYYNNGAAEYRFNVHDSGNVVNKNNSYGAISDAKLKRDIAPAASQWSDIKILAGLAKKFRHLNDDTFQLGLIAQDVEAVSPGLVEAIPDRELFEDTKQDGQDIVTFQNERFTGTFTKSVKYSVLYMKSVKALGEAMERIESLEDRVDALEI